MCTFDAKGDLAEGRQVEITIGDSLIMITPATEREPFTAFLRLRGRCRRVIPASRFSGSDQP